MGPNAEETGRGSVPGGSALSDRRAALYILSATAVSGCSAYAITVLAGLRLGTEGYVPIGAFLSALYLVITALAGVQQEVTRAARPRDPSTRAPSRPLLRGFILRTAVVVVGPLILTAPLWGSRAFPGYGFSLVLPLVVGSAAYLLIAATSGVFAGLAHWRAVAALVAGDGLLRLAAAGVAMFFTDDPRTIAWMLVVPFPAVALIVWPWARRHVVGRFELDVGGRQLSWNAARSVLAGTSMGVLVSGFPMLVAATSPATGQELVSAAMLAITLARAPLIVVAISFQGFLIGLFRRPSGVARRLVPLLAATGVASLALGALGWSLGPNTFEAVFGEDFRLGRPLIASIMVSGGLVAALCITGAATLARGLHTWYAAGWATSSAVAAAILFLPLAFDARVALALLVAPVLGVAIHLAALRESKTPARLQNTET